MRALHAFRRSFAACTPEGWDDVSFHGSPQIPTPNMDVLAADGIILNNYYVQPTCTPSRAALMTGLYPIHTGMQHSVLQPAQPYGLPLEVTIMPQHFKNLGYETHMIGKGLALERLPPKVSIRRSNARLCVSSKRRPCSLSLEGDGG
ncbi:hypothetical protein HPB47_010615 [Ixodes persulcatus]|uniref:Uncharacterized protein n=1 Tax=Ixodes persulcatus TaxID=34615 RepID=A0AC60NYN3_IXOPE|nr:hypothetical protein HPB47_010615 [Ixodes persulcatus]